jgi:hypothetical protein
LGLSISVLAGIGYMALMGAPLHYMAVNMIALVVALTAIYVFQSPVSFGFIAVSMGLIVLLLFLPLFTGPDLDGVRRWIGIGPLKLHTGMMLLPLLAALMPFVDARLSCAVVAFAGMALSLQPDLASALALLCASATHAAKNLSRCTMAMTAAALLALTYTIIVEYPLQPVRFVEYVFADAYEYSPLAAIFLVICSAASILFLWRMNPNSLAVIAAMAGFFLASFFGAYPVPLIGYGAAPILGLALAIIFLPKYPRTAGSISDC